ncbi:MmcQ/YjbR family DNA-binding protein [Plantactinospora sp. B6F1]|uniref:MmcQ/YjbR family DNA-binding protein n=1 Tax=Plantactinospora sp. B6F1 TaxID=3158971 RepID=UPI0032D936A3
MTWAEMLAYCLAKPGAWQGEPWEGDVVVKVGPRIFAFLGQESRSSVGVKCGPNRKAVDASHSAIVARLPKRDRPTA